MSTDLPPLTTPEDLQHLIKQLADRIDELEAELESERDRRERLEGLVEVRDGHRDGTGAHLEDIHLNGLPVGQILTAKASRSDVDDLEARVSALEDGTPSADPAEQPTTLQMYASLPPAGRDALDPTDRRAVVIFDHWGEWAQTAPIGKSVLTTTRDRSGSSRIIKLLAAATGEDLQWTEVYRAMKRVATLSGSSSDGRDATGGAFDYLHSWSDPWGEGQQTVKALVLRRPDQLNPENVTEDETA